jgi:AmmeMemoRadiSam system protein A
MIKFTTREDLARFAIEYFLDHRTLPVVDPKNVAKDLTTVTPCFVTLYVKDRLKGCVGNYQTGEPLYSNIIKNAVNSAFYDNRFMSVTHDDLKDLKIHVSCLTSPKPYRPKDLKQLLSHLTNTQPGLIISSGFNQALFLPQVWEELPRPEDFLTHLCLKAGLPRDFWQNPDKLQFQEFTAF